MLRLRPFEVSDSEAILSWANEEKTFYQWTAGVLGSYPLSVEQFSSVRERSAFTMTDDDIPVGFLAMRRPTPSKEIQRFGFVIVDHRKRGKGYGKQMLMLALKEAKEHQGAKKVTLGVFKNNEKAYHCYKAAGFTDVSVEEPETYTVLGEDWECLEMEVLL